MNRNDPLCSVCRNEAMVGVILPLLPVRGLRWSWPSFLFGAMMVQKGVRGENENRFETDKELSPYTIIINDVLSTQQATRQWRLWLCRRHVVF